MNMKRIFLPGLIVALMLTETSFAGGPSPDWKDTEISRLVGLPQKIEVVPPAKDLPPKVAAFSGRWEGVWDFSEMPVVLIVESISSTTVNVINCVGKGKAGNKPEYSRRKGKVFLGDRIRIEIPVWWYDGRGQYVIDLPLEISEDLKTLHGEVQTRGTRKASITMKKIEE